MKNFRANLVLLILLLLAAVTSLFALYGGSEELSCSQIFAELFRDGGTGGFNHLIVWELRVPRVLLALLAGAALGGAGAVLQSVLHNPLVSPDLLGISAGGGLAGVLVLLFLPEYAGWLKVAVCCGALLVAVMVYLAAWKRGVTPDRLLLAGVAVSAVFGTVSTTLLMLNPDAEQLPGIFNFMLGGFDGCSFEELKSFLPVFALAFAGYLLLIPKLDVMSLGDDGAVSLGVNVPAARLFALGSAALGAAGAAGVAGLIGFAGLIAPHTVRFLCNSGKHVYLVPGSVLMGALLVSWGDWAGRLLAPEHSDIPAGVFLTGGGAMFFLVLLMMKRRG